MFEKLNQNLDRVVAVLMMLFAGYQLLRIGLTKPPPEMLAVLLFSVLYLLLRNKLNVKAELPPLRTGPIIQKVNHIIFVLSLVASIWLLHQNLYLRPTSYYLVTFIAVISIVWDILHSTDKTTSQSVILFKIVILALIFRAGIYFEFPGVAGVDPWEHNLIIGQTISTGHVTQYLNDAMNSFNSYISLPIFHIGAATTQIVTALPISSSIFAFAGFFETLTSVFVFLVARKAIGIKVALFSALFFSLADYSVIWGVQIIPTSLGIGLVAMILYLIFSTKPQNRASLAILLLISSATLILAHTLSAFIMLCILIATFIGFKIFHWWSRHDTRREAVISSAFVCLFFVGMVTWWMTISTAPGESFFDGQVLRLRLVTATVGEIVTGQSDNVTTLVRLFNEGGYSLLVGLGLMSCLVYLRPQNRSLYTILLILIAVSLLLIQAANLSALEIFTLISRWIAFQYIVISILGAATIISLSILIRNNARRLLMITFTGVLIVFLMMVNNVSSPDTPLLKYDIRRVSYTESELCSIKTITGVLKNQPVTDLYFAIAWLNTITRSEYLDMQSGRVLIVRKYDLFHPEYNERHSTQITDLAGGASGTYMFENRPIVVAEYVRKLEAGKQALIYVSDTVSVWQMP